LSLHLSQAIFLFVTAVIGGTLNAVAGGGSFISFPALLFTGVPPVQANATNTVALWTGLTASGGAYLHRLNVPRRVFLPLLGSVINGVAVLAFIPARAVFWPQCAVMIVGALAGGWFGAHYSQRADPKKVRYVVIAVGFAMTAYFFVTVY